MSEYNIKILKCSDPKLWYANLVGKYEGTLNDCIEFMIERARNNEGANGETHLENIGGWLDK